MKKTLSVLFATALCTVTAMAQTAIIGPGLNNGDLEATDSTAPFVPPGGSISTDFNHTPDGAQSLAIDLTANNLEGQWKGFADAGNGMGVIADVSEGEIVSTGAWVYVPAATTFGADEATAQAGTNNVIIALEGFNDVSPANTNNLWGGNLTGAFTAQSLTGIARDSWVLVSLPSVTVPENVTQVRTRPFNLNTARLVNGKDGFGDGENAATPADWMANGYSGFVYIDDVFLTVSPAPPEPPVGVGINSEINNGDLENATLTPFGGGYASSSEEFNHTPGGSRSLEIDLTDASTGNQWKGLVASEVTIDDSAVKEGNILTQSLWVYVPSDTVFGDPSPNASNSIILNAFTGDAAETFTGAFSLTTVERDTWVKVSRDVTIPAGVTSYTTNKWFLGTNSDPVAAGYMGSIFIDDVTFAAAPPPREVTIIGGGINNGDMEAASLSPFVGMISTEQNNTPDGSQSLEFDLQQPTDFGQWKGLLTEQTSPVLQQNETFDLAAWVYVPTSAGLGNEGNTTAISINIRAIPEGGGAFVSLPNTIFQDLKLIDRDTWVKVEATDLVLPEGGPFESVNTGGWNITRINEVNGTPAPDSVASDWAAEGYSGTVFIDDVSFIQRRPAPPREGIFITDITFENNEVVITFESTVENLLMYRSTTGLEEDDFEEYSEGLITSPYVDDDPADGNAFYQIRDANAG